MGNIIIKTLKSNTFNHYVTRVLILICFFIQMDIKVFNYNINDINLPPELPPPNEWMAELNVIHPETRKTLFSVRVYITIRRDGKIGAMG